jgi:hydrogenase maturation protein HypF
MTESQILVFGVVQGVGFRPTVYRIAKALGLKGFVRNNGSNVEIVVDKDAELFVEQLKKELPPLARLDKMEVHDLGNKKTNFKIFEIRESREGRRDAPIPPDTAMCPDCLKEMFDPKDRRHLYPFTNCTNCGARFSVIADMPYDRPNTSMDEFKLCKDCLKEYKDPSNRRFHAQTISCWKEGLHYTLYDKKGKPVKCKDPIAQFAKLTDGGAVGVVKGWGGMHITCTLDKIGAMREWYKRPSKPFAVMVRDLKVAKKFAVIGEFEEKILCGPERPITILPKRKGVKELEGISPGLDNIGLYLPYAGAHHLLFHHLKADALVMTSANPAGEPMIIDNKEAFSLGLDAYLLHDRRIINRVDDSVLIPFEGKRFFIRKSRGFTPLYLPVKYDNIILSVGPERNVNASISKAGRVYTSQYIGHSYKYNVMEFLDHATRYLMRLLGIKTLSAVAMDLHPQYPTRAFAKRMAAEFQAPLYEVQHHFAHSTSLMLDNGIEDQVACISVDGTGYGTDGTIWGGEILVNDLKDFKRVGTLQSFPLIGGDQAVRDPKRLVFAIREMLKLGNELIPDNTAKIYSKAMSSSTRTSSLGRVLDALSCWLGVGCVRSYDGEPAMRLETLLSKGKPVHTKAFEEVCTIKGTAPSVIQTLPMFDKLEELLCTCGGAERTKEDLAASFVTVLMDRMVQLACDSADAAGTKYVGLTGGVSYNIPIVKMVKQQVKARNKELLVHDKVPNGDGGISIGQNVHIGERLKHEK